MDQRIQIVCSEVESHLAGSLRITDLSRSVNLSSSRLRHLFKAETGQTLAQYRNGVRLAEARVLLGTTLMRVKEIRNLMGVGSASHFTHDFKEVYDFSPTQYRAQAKRFLPIDGSFEVLASSGKE